MKTVSLQIHVTSFVYVCVFMCALVCVCVCVFPQSVTWTLPMSTTGERTADAAHSFIYDSFLSPLYCIVVIVYFITVAFVFM